jgi:hypothetical protein
MSDTSDPKHDECVGAPSILTNEQLRHLHVVYKRALEEYAEATSAIYACIRRRILPTAEALARKQVAQVALQCERRAFWKASRRFARASERTHSATVE